MADLSSYINIRANAVTTTNANSVVSTTGNINAGNITATGFISAAGNITGNYFIGNGSQLTGITGASNYSNANVTSFLGAYGSNTISTSGNITAGNLIGNISVTNSVTGTLSNVTLVASGKSWVFDNTGNLTVPTAGNILLSNAQSTISSAGNITGNYFIGNGSQLTGLPASYSNANVATFLASFGSNTITTTGNITAGNFVGNGAALTNVTVSVAGNIVGSQANVGIVAGSYTYTFDNTGNITLPTGGDLVFSGNTSLTSISNGNITIDPNGTGQLVVTAITPASFGNTLSVTGTVTSNGTTNGTAFAVGNGAVSNVALGFFPTGNTAGNYAIRDYSTANSIMYFDTTIGSANIGGSFVFRGSNAFTTYATINQYGAVQPTKPGFRVYGNGVTTPLSTTQNGNGVLNGNNWAVDYNQGSYLNSTTGVFTAPVTGLYATSLVARVANNTAPSAQICIVKNYANAGGTVQAMWESGTNCTTNHFGVSSISKLNAGDTLVIKVTLAQLTFDANDNWSVAFLG